MAIYEVKKLHKIKMEEIPKETEDIGTELDNSKSNINNSGREEEEEENTIVELTLDIIEAEDEDEDEEDEGEGDQRPENQGPTGIQSGKTIKRTRREKLMDKLRQLEVDPYFYESEAKEKARTLYASYVNDFSLELLDNEDYIEILKKKKEQRVHDIQKMSTTRIEAENKEIETQITEIDNEIEKLTNEIKALKKMTTKSEKKGEENANP